MTNIILYTILFIEYNVQQITMFAFVNIFLDVKIKKSIYYLLSIPITATGIVCDLSSELSTYIQGSELLVTYKLFLTVIPEIIILLTLTKGKFIKKLFTIILVFGTTITLDAIAVQLCAFTGVASDYSNASLGVRVLGNLFFTFSYIIITLVLNKIVKRKNQQQSLKDLIIFTFFFIAQFSLIILSTHTVSSVTDSFSVSICVVSLITIIADIIIVQLIEKASEKAHLEEQLKCIEEIQKGEKDYYNNLVEKEELMSKIRHDWNEQLQTALTLCAEDNSEKATKARQIISELNENLIKSVPKKFTQNITLNALLNSKSKLLEDADIKYKFDVQLKEKINIDLINLCSIFSNLINNAHEYSIKNADNDNFIDLKAKQIDNKIIIRCTNTIKKSDEIIQQNNFRTTKADRKNHGYGLAIIKSLTEKYNGNMNIDIENNQFVANIYLIEN